GELDPLAVPRALRRHLEREGRARHETAPRIIGEQLELDRALEPVRLDEPTDTELDVRRALGTVGPPAGRAHSEMSTRTRCPSASAVTSARSAFAVRPPRPMTRPRSSGCTRTSSTSPRAVSAEPTATSAGWS